MDNQRTVQQNRALHLWFRQVAETLNEAGLDVRKTLKPEIEIPWSGTLIKEFIWRPVQKMQLDKQSSIALTTKDIDVIFETLNRFLAKHGITVPFPSKNKDWTSMPEL